MAAVKSYLMDELTTDGMCGDLFDHIDDLLEFPNDDFMAQQSGTMETPYNPGGGFILPTAPVSPAVAPPIKSPPQQHDGNCEGLLGGGDMVRNHITINHAADTAELECGGNKTCFEELDIADLEWVSNFMDDSANSFSMDYLTNSISKPKIQTESMFRTPSPVSVLQPNSRSVSGSGGSASSSSSSSNCGSIAGTNSGKELVSFSSPNPVSAVPARARSKRPRPRPSAFSPRLQKITIHPFLDDECYGEYAMKKAAKEEPLSPLAAEDTSQVAVRKCTHCEIQKTPQWRAGPMGPKTLCNACGVRYKSGRLFPEYRPAASPTFVASLHSNSHKRVVEMRINGGPGAATSSCDLLEYIRRKE